MSKKKPAPKKMTRSSLPANEHHESQAVESLTVLWSFCTLATLVFAIVFIVLQGYMVSTQVDPEIPTTISVIANLLLFTSVVTGSMGGILTPIVQSRRKRKAPKSLEIGAYIIAAVPWIFVAIAISQ